MKRLLASVFALVGIGSSAQPQQRVQSFDPNSILFSTPTLSNDIATLEPVAHEPSQSDIVFNEDEWSQVEFFPKTQISNIKRILIDYKAFEQAHRTKHGWRKVYLRKVDRAPVVTGSQPVQQLESVLGVKAGSSPILTSSGAISGRIKNGFSLALGGNVTLYGYVVGQGIPVLGASVGQNPDDLKLTQAFIKLNSSNGLVLVDWRSQLVLMSVSASGQVDVWKP